MQRLLFVLTISVLFTITMHAQVITATNGNVGIGIDPPAAKLHVNGSQIIETSGNTTNSRTLTIRNAGTGQVFFGTYHGAWRSSLQIQNNNATMGVFLAPPETDYNFTILRSINGGLKMDVGGSFSDIGTNALSILPNANIGIGTASPQARLHVKNGDLMAGDPSYDNTNVRVSGAGIPVVKFTRWTGSGSGQHNAFIGQFYNGGEYSFGIGTGSSSTGDQDAASPVITATIGGNVGVGTTTPRVLLDVGGEIRIGKMSDFPAEGAVSEGYWGNYIVGNATTSQKLKFGVSNDMFTRAEILLDNSNRQDGTISFKTANGSGGAETRMFINGSGTVGIGTTSVNSDYGLFVEKGIRTRKIKVDQAVWPDYVFSSSYNLPSLQEVEAFIKRYKHLPDVPSAQEVEKNGLDMGENQAVLLKKIEELTLYAIDADKQLSSQKKQLEVQSDQLSSQVEQLKAQMELIRELQQQLAELKKDRQPVTPVAPTNKEPIK